MMKELLSSVTTKGQVTIPAEVRQLLGISAHDKVAFLIEDGHVRLARRGSVVGRTAGALATKGRLRTARQLREDAELAIAEDRDMTEGR